MLNDWGKIVKKLLTSSLPALRPGPRYRPACDLFFIQFQVIFLFKIYSSILLKKFWLVVIFHWNYHTINLKYTLQRHWPFSMNAPVTKMLNISFWQQIFRLEFGREKKTRREVHRTNCPHQPTCFVYLDLWSYVL